MKNQTFKHYPTLKTFEQDTKRLEAKGWILTYYHLNENKILATFIYPANEVM